MTKKDPFKHLNEEVEANKQMIPTSVFSDSAVVSIPKGFKAILIRKDFNPEITNQIEVLENELTSLPPIKTDEDLQKVNGSLKKAKTLIKTGGSERLLMASGLKEEDKALINLERSTFKKLSDLVELQNKRATDYQLEKDRKAKELQDKIEADRQAELKKIQDEKDRVQNISNKIIQFERNILNEISASKYEDVDSNIALLSGVKFTTEVYQEFLPDALEILDRCKMLFQNRKTELTQLHELSLKNKEAAEQLEKEQQEKIKSEQQELEAKKDSINEMLADSHANEVLNVQMQTELKNSMVEKPSSVMRTYQADFTSIDMSLLPDEYKTFDEKKIKEAVKAGCREIPGVKITDKLSNVSR